MKKISTLIIIAVTLLSCKLTDQDAVEAEEVTAPAIKDSIVVNDKDEHGCLATAGYIWSRMNKECIKGYTGMQLNPVDKPENEDETLSAYVILSEDQDKAEVFLPNEANSLILVRLAEGKPWIFEDWQLQPWKGYVLKKGADAKYAGDGQLGKKVTETDIAE